MIHIIFSTVRSNIFLGGSDGQFKLFSAGIFGKRLVGRQSIRRNQPQKDKVVVYGEYWLKNHPSTGGVRKKPRLDMVLPFLFLLLYVLNIS